MNLSPAGLADLDSLLYWVATALYAVAASLHLLRLYFPEWRVVAWADRILGAALAANTAGLLFHWYRAGHAPYISRLEVVSSTVWLAVVVFILARRWIPDLAATGGFLLSLATLALGFVGTASTTNVSEPPLSFATVWLGIHVVFTQLFVICALLASGIAYVELTGITPGGRLEVPRGRAADDLIYRLTAVGFIFLTVMIIAGAIWANHAWGRYWGWDSIEVWSLICWLIYALELHLIRTFGWHGRRLAWLSFGALVVALFSMFGVVLVFPSIHGSYMVR